MYKAAKVISHSNTINKYKLDILKNVMLKNTLANVPDVLDLSLFLQSLHGPAIVTHSQVKEKSYHSSFYFWPHLILTSRYQPF